MDNFIEEKEEPAGTVVYRNAAEWLRPVGRGAGVSLVIPKNVANKLGIKPGQHAEIQVVVKKNRGIFIGVFEVPVDEKEGAENK